jgi:hypothetical protein
LVTAGSADAGNRWRLGTSEYQANPHIIESETFYLAKGTAPLYVHPDTGIQFTPAQINAMELGLEIL